MQATMTFWLPVAWPTPIYNFPGHVDPEGGDEHRRCHPLLHQPRLVHLPHQNCPADLGHVVRHGQITGAAEQPGRRLRDQLPLCKDGQDKGHCAVREAL